MTDSARQKAYEAEKARLDARKTNKNVKCTPPNKKCGGRCIPPSWDCRLKNEGSDKHLMAVKTDPLKGAASIQRGFKRLAKGVVTGNIAEVQSGRGTITRGIVTVTPGNLQQKKELRQKIDRRTRFIGTVALLGVGGYALHTQAKKYGPYKRNVGDKIDIFARNGYNAALDRMPILGGIRENNRRAAATNTARTAEAILKEQTKGPAALERTLTEAGADPLSSIQKGDAISANELKRALDRQDKDSAERNQRFDEWDGANRTTFLGVTKVTSKNDFFKGEELSIYAEPAGENFLREAYGLKGKTGAALRLELGDQFRADRADYFRFAQQNGFKVKGGQKPFMDADTATKFAEFATESLKGQKEIRNAAQVHIEGLVREGGVQDRANTVYRDTITGFSNYFGEATKLSQTAPGVPIIREQRQLVEKADQARARELASRMPDLKLEGNIGPSVGEVIRRGYYATKVAGTKKSTYSVSDRLFRSAASELTGRPVNSITEAQQILRDKGFTGATYVQTAQTVKQAPKKKLTKQQRLRTTTELAKKYREQGLSDVAAMQAAVKEMKERGDGFSSYEAAFLEARYDFKEGDRLGKPCGNSYIPKKHKCLKSKSTVSSSTKQESGTSTKKKAAIAGAVIGGAALLGIAAVTASNVKTLQDPNKTPLTASPSIKEVVKAAKKESGKKSSSEAMGYYYTQKSGLKPGDVVYFRNEKDPQAHYGIYLGEGSDGIVRAVVANTKESRFSWASALEIGSTKPGVKAPQALMTPLVKAPKLNSKEAEKIDSKEVVRRAIRIAGADYKFTVTKDNCEALANSIAYNTPESEQLKRLRITTKLLLDNTIVRSQKRQARQALKRKKAEGRSRTASEFIEFLKGEQEFANAEGAKLRAQYSHYFTSERKDATTAEIGLISEEQLWAIIKDYGSAIKAQAITDYLTVAVLVNRLDKEEA